MRHFWVIWSVICILCNQLKMKERLCLGEYAFNVPVGIFSHSISIIMLKINQKLWQMPIIVCKDDTQFCKRLKTSKQCLFSLLRNSWQSCSCFLLFSHYVSFTQINVYLLQNITCIIQCISVCFFVELLSGVLAVETLLHKVENKTSWSVKPQAYQLLPYFEIY